MLRLLLLLLLSLWATFASAITCNAPLVVAFSGDWKPYFYEYAKQQYDGFDYQLLTSAAKNISCDVKVLAMTEFRSMLEQQKGTFDVYIGATYTKDREKTFHFSQPYREEVIGFAFATKFGNSKTTTLEQLLRSGGRVGINMTGYFGDNVESLKNQFEDQFVHAFALSDRLKMLVEGELDVVVDDRSALCSQLQDMQIYGVELQRSNKHPAIVLAETTLHKDNVHFMLSRRTISAELLGIFNQHLSALLTQQTAPKTSRCQLKKLVSAQ